MTSIWELESLIKLKDKLRSILTDRGIQNQASDNLNTLVEKVNQIQNDVIFNSVLSDSVENLYNDKILKLNQYTFYCNQSITGTVEFPNAITLGDYSLASMKNIKKFIGNKVEAIGTNSFNASLIEEICCRKLTSLGSQCLIGCNKLKKCYIPLGIFSGAMCISSTSLEYLCVQARDYVSGNSLNIKNDLNAKMIVLNCLKLVTCSSIANFPSYALTEGECYFYVPSSLVETYKTATNWSTYADRFRAIEDYKNEICEVFPLFEEDYAGTWDESEVLE